MILFTLYYTKWKSLFCYIFPDLNNKAFFTEVQNFFLHPDPWSGLRPYFLLEGVEEGSGLRLNLAVGYGVQRRRFDTPVGYHRFGTPVGCHWLMVAGVNYKANTNLDGPHAEAGPHLCAASQCRMGLQTLRSCLSAYKPRAVPTLVFGRTFRWLVAEEEDLDEEEEVLEGSGVSRCTTYTSFIFQT